MAWIFSFIDSIVISPEPACRIGQNINQRNKQEKEENHWQNFHVIACPMLFKSAHVASHQVYSKKIQKIQEMCMHVWIRLGVDDGKSGWKAGGGLRYSEGFLRNSCLLNLPTKPVPFQLHSIPKTILQLSIQRNTLEFLKNLQVACIMNRICSAAGDSYGFVSIKNTFWKVSLLPYLTVTIGWRKMNFI